MAKQPGSTLAEVVSALSPNGLDAGVDYGAYLDVVNRTLGPAQGATPAQGSRESSGNKPFDWGNTVPQPTSPMFPGPNPIADILATLTGHAPAKVAPSRVQVASLDPLPSATPAPNLPPVRQQPSAPAPARAVPVFEPPAAPAAPAAPVSAAPAHNPIHDVRLPPATPQYVSPPRATAIAPTGPFRDNAPGANGSAVPNKDQTRLTPNAAVGASAVPEDLISRTFNSLPTAQGPFNTGEDLAFNPVPGMPNTSQVAASPVRNPLPPIPPSTLPSPTPTVDERSLATKGYGDLTSMLGGPAASPAASNRLDGPIKAAAGKQVVAPTPAMPSQDMRMARQPPIGNVKLSDADREMLIRAVATEVDPRIARTNPEAFKLQVERVTDTMLNRLASDQFPDTAVGMLNQFNQFSAVNGPVARPGVENIPATRADPALRDIMSSYLDQRTTGKVASSVGGAVNYANPKVADASNLGWVNALNYAVDDAGPFSHKYGVASGMRPAEATFGNPANNAFNFLSGGVMGAFTQPQMSRLSNSSKPVQVKASTAPISELMGGTALTPKVDRNSPTMLRPTSEKQQPMAREPISNAFTQPAARPMAAPTRVAAAAPTKISSPTLQSSMGGNGSNGGGLASAPSFTGSNTGGSGSRTAVTSTSSSAKTATTSSGKISSPTVSTSSQKTSSPTSSSKTSGSAKSSSAKNR